MSTLQGQVGLVTMTVEITRKATGVTETVELTGALSEEQLTDLRRVLPDAEESPDGRHA